jgi:hypothetical protein
VDATNNNKRTRANSGRQQSNRVCGQRGADASRGNQGRRPLATLALIALASAAAVFAPDAPGNAQERLVALSMGARSSSITITAGKTQDVRVDAPFTDVTVGDPEIADVTPLTDHSLSILGKKIGTTRVSIYGEGKRTVGIFDVEVSYDVPRLAAELNRITGGGLRVSSVNGRIMLSGSAPDAVTLDKAVAIARQFAPDVINAVQVLSPQLVVLEVRFVEASREASRELGVQWNSFGKNTLTNIGSQVPAPQLPVTTPGGPFQQQPLITQGSQARMFFPTSCRSRPSLQPASSRGRRLSGSCWERSIAADSLSMSPSMRSSRRGSSAAWPSPTWWRFPATPPAFLPAASTPFRCPARSEPSPSIIRPTASGSPSPRRCCAMVPSTW